MKQSTQKELSTTVLDWLRSTNNKLQPSYIKEQLTTHPDYPALTSVIDLLDAGNMKYQAVQADASYINEFNYPALAHIKEPGNEYMHIIPDASAWDIQKDITANWSGITIFPEKNASWQNEEYEIAIKNEQQQKIQLSLWGVLVIILLSASVYFKPSLFYNLFGLVAAIGIVISIAAFITELGIQNSTIKQVCGTVSKGGCEQVLKSKLAKGIFGITPADAALIYFSAQFIVYLVSVFYNTAFLFLPYLAIAGIVLVIVSIYSQAILLKQWCALCLGIAGVLLLHASIASFELGHFSISPLAIFAVAFLFCTMALMPIKKLIKATIAAKPMLTELKNWKADTELFNAQLKNEQKVDTATWQSDLLIGDKTAPVLITVACNPYCGPCARAHKQLDELLKKHTGKLKVQVRLLCNPANEKDARTIAVKAILQQATVITSDSEMQQMLTD